ncbi:hypothetical protein D7D25_12105 [Proteiniphilum sp. X52]|nr:hypothetical protein D7D25_12105 [Proteiniphilum sp. X52]
MYFLGEKNPSFSLIINLNGSLFSINWNKFVPWDVELAAVRIYPYRADIKNRRKTDKISSCFFILFHSLVGNFTYQPKGSPQQNPLTCVKTTGTRGSAPSSD